MDIGGEENARVESGRNASLFMQTAPRNHLRAVW